MEENSEKITYESLWKAIIRPPRDYYKEEELGPLVFNFNGKTYLRKDFEIVDFHGKKLKVSFIEPDIKDRPNDIMPCVIYVHANSSSRVEGINNKKWLLKNDINLCAFDFEGSGYSEGEYISLGYHEKHQLKNIVDFVEKYPGVGDIGLWGRSMGAATTLIYASMDPRIKAIVVDSPFSDFRRVAKEMCLAQVSVPGFLIEGAISIIGKSVYKKNGMKINEIKAIEAVKNCYIPVIFIHARDDDIVKFQHSLDLFNNYAGSNKELKDVNGGHNGKRATMLLEHVGRFFFKYLNNEDFNFNDNIKKSKTEHFTTTSPFIPDNNNNNNKTIENFNFDLNNRRKKTIYEEWGIGNGKTVMKNYYTEPNKQEFNSIDKNKKEEDKKNIDNKQDNINNISNKSYESNIKDNSKTLNNSNKYTNINNNQKPMTYLNSNNYLNPNINQNINSNSNNNNININNNNINNVDNNFDIYQPVRKRTIYDELNIRK